MKKTPRAVAVILLLCLLCSPFAGAEHFPATSHPQISFEEMGEGTYDYADFQALLAEFSTAAQRANAAEEVRELTARLIAEIDVVETQYALAELYYYLEVDNTERQQHQEAMRSIVQDVWDEALLALSIALEGPNEQTVVEALGGHEIAYDFYGYEPLTERMREFSKQENDLIQNYYSLTAEALSDADYVAAVGPIFIQLRDLRINMAEEYGYDNYAEMTSLHTYDREYGVRDIIRFCHNVRDDLVDAFFSVYDLYTSATERKLNSVPEYTQEQLVELLGRHIGTLSSELEEAYLHMARHGLYDISPSGSKAEIGFTTPLPQHGTAFIYDSPVDSTVQNFSTLVHEFGHFCAEHFNAEPTLLRLNDYDLFEMHSQGLEVLFFPFYDDIYGDSAEAVLQLQLEDFLYNIIYCSYLAELELSIYQNPDWSLDDINRHSAQLLEAYRLSFSDQPLESDTDWLYTDHLITSPLYIISYPVSGVAVLELWRLSLSDHAAAVETYLSLMASGTSETFLDTLDTLGMQDVFAAQSTRAIAAAVYGYFDTTPDDSGRNYMVLGYLIAAAATFLILFSLWRRRARRYYEEASEPSLL